jgi:dissimilatory sulfite reductase related protein
VTAGENRTDGPKIREIEGNHILFDAEGFLEDPDDWSESVARALARESGHLQMTEDHWRVLRFLRNYYYQNGRAPLNKQLRTGLGMRISDIQGLFSEGIKYGARRLAGLPNPKSCM